MVDSGSAGEGGTAAAWRAHGHKLAAKGDKDNVNGNRLQVCHRCGHGSAARSAPGHFDLHQGNPAPWFVHCVGLDSWRSSRRDRAQEIDIMLGPQVAACAKPVVEFDAALI